MPDHSLASWALRTSRVTDAPHASGVMPMVATEVLCWRIWWASVVVLHMASILHAENAPVGVPGLDDVCTRLPASEPRCSPEICSIAAGAHVQLEARTYYQDQAVVLPPGARIVGAGINKTVIVNCGAPSTTMRGFILGNNTYIGHFTWQGNSPSRGEFSGIVQTPGCADTGACNLSRCIPAGGDCAGAANVTVEHIHNRPYDNGSAWWPLVNDAAWFPRTVPWGPERATGSRNITVRGLISWGTWADGMNFHGGHQNVLVEDCQISYTGDDPYGLWPDSVAATENHANCQRNIVLRNNVGRWPRQGGPHSGGNHAGSQYVARNYPDCAGNIANGGGNWHCCFASYGGGSGVQFLHNHCEGAQGVVRFLASYPFTVKNQTIFCGPVAVAGNTYAAMPGQGVGCRSNNSTQGWCEKSVADFCGGEEKIPPIPASGDTCGGQTAPVPLRAVTIGGQCNSSEPSLPSRCTNGGGCEKIPGVAGVCHNGQAGDGVRCVSATELAQLVERGTTCKGFSDVCVLY